MVATTATIRARLGAGHVLYRDLPDESPDGLPGHEGVFLLCSLWLVDNLATQGRLDEAMALVASILTAAGGTDLLVNIMEGKQEARHPFYRIAELTDESEDRAIWGINFPLQYDRYLRKLFQHRQRAGLAGTSIGILRSPKKIPRPIEYQQS